jgi:hypothetical protein
MHPEFIQFIAQERTKEFELAAARAVLAAEARTAAASPVDERSLAIRLCRVGDHEALERLALLEGRKLPDGSFVIGEVDGDVAAAWPLDENEPVLADPFVRTDQLVSLMALRVAQLGRAERRLLPRFRRHAAAA